MKTIEMKMLQDAKASNGGGVRDRKYGLDVVNTLLRKGYIAAKKGHGFNLDGSRLMVITAAGREFLDRERNVPELIEEEGQRVGFAASTIHLDGGEAPPWE